jgi:hypothetical protein
MTCVHSFSNAGLPGNTYCMISDAHIHVNMFVDGRYAQWGSNPHKPLTWIRKLSILWGHHSILLEVRTGGQWEYNSGFMAKIEVDGEPLSLAAPGVQARLYGNTATLTWVEAEKSMENPHDIYDIFLGDVAAFRLTLKPEIPYMRVEDDAAVHINVEVLNLKLSSFAHGILGQTYRPGTYQKL